MNAHKTSIVILLILWSFSAQMVWAQQVGFETRKEKGKCYCMYTIPATVHRASFTYPIYTGPLDSADFAFIQEMEFWYDEVSPPDTLLVVTDTSKTKDYLWETFTETHQEGEPETIWLEVLCVNKSSIWVIELMAKKLKTLGYYSGPIKDVDTNGVKAAMIEYQKANGLYEGVLSIQTLDA